LYRFLDYLEVAQCRKFDTEVLEGGIGHVDQQYVKDDIELCDLDSVLARKHDNVLCFALL
jgi:hypothetical protein